MRDAAGLRQKNNLIDAGILELAPPRADVRGRADAIGSAAFRQREVLRLVLVVLPQVGLTRLVIAEECVMPEATEEESLMLCRELTHLVLVSIAEERTRNRDVRVDRVAGRFAFVFQRRVIIADPLPRFLRRDERECQRAEAE